MKYKNREEIIENISSDILDVRLRFTGMKEGNLKYTNDGKSYPLINIYCSMDEVSNMNFNSMETLRTLLLLSDCVQVYFKDECQLWDCNK